MQKTYVDPDMGQEDPLEKEMATHSSILSWEILWTEEPGGLEPTKLWKVRHDLANKQQPLWWQKEKELKSLLMEGEREEWKSWLETQH